MSKVKGKILISLAFVVVSIILLILSFQGGGNNQLVQIERVRQVEYSVLIGGQKIYVELADTPALRAQGLSGRDPLPDGQGMLFIFPEPGQHGFWMKDMKFPLDIIWIMDDTIVDIWESAPVPSNGNIPSYSPKEEANYVLEINAGFVADNSVKIGNFVTLDIGDTN